MGFGSSSPVIVSHSRQTAPQLYQGGEKGFRREHFESFDETRRR
jgi:hypothetical protein